MILIGSRGLGVNSPHSDWDYIELDDREGTSYRDIINDHFAKKEHCYHYPKEYKMKLARFEIDDPDDMQFIYNAEDYRHGVTNINPFEYMDKWKEKLSNFDFWNNHFWDKHRNTYFKRAYHLIYNLECIKHNTLYPPMNRVKAVHDRTMSAEEYISIVREIQSL